MFSLLVRRHGDIVEERHGDIVVEGHGDIDKEGHGDRAAECSKSKRRAALLIGDSCEPHFDQCAVMQRGRNLTVRQLAPACTIV